MKRLIIACAIVLLLTGGAYYWFYRCPDGEIVTGADYTGIIWRKGDVRSPYTFWPLKKSDIPTIEAGLTKFLDGRARLSDYRRYYSPLSDGKSTFVNIMLYSKKAMSRHVWLKGIVIADGEHWDLRWYPETCSFTVLYPTTRE